MFGATGPTHAAVETVPEPPPTEPETTEPETSEPEETAPPTSEPPASEPHATADDDSVSTAAAIAGAIGVLALIGVAAWWMVRRADEDDEPHPRPPASDEPLPGQEVL
jgi:hypothetical protein